jgi:hypothetical protein
LEDHPSRRGWRQFLLRAGLDMRNMLKKVVLMVSFLLVSTVSIPASLHKRSDCREEANALESFEDGWNKTFGGPDFDSGFFVQQTRDGGYIIVGATSSYAEDTKAWLIKTDENGNLEWDKIFFYPGGNLGYSVDQTTDEGYIITGDRDVRKGDAWLVKTDKYGNLEWEKTFGYENEDFGHSVQQTRDGGYIIGGQSSFKGYEAWLIKTDRYGNEEWNRTFDMPGDSLCWEVPCLLLNIFL